MDNKNEVKVMIGSTAGYVSNKFVEDIKLAPGEICNMVCNFSDNCPGMDESRGTDFVCCINELKKIQKEANDELSKRNLGR